jgi:hypothetical protein
MINNHVEGFHSKLNKWSLKVHPDIYTLVDLFKLVDSSMVNDFELRKVADINDEPARGPTMLEKYFKLKKYLENMKAGHLTLERYIQKTSTCIGFSTIIQTDRDETNQERIRAILNLNFFIYYLDSISKIKMSRL